MRDYFVHKEPVLNRRKAVYGQELCFRKPTTDIGDSEWNDVRIDGEIVETIGPIDGFERLTANRHSFLNVDLAGLEHNIEHGLPRRSVLQLAESEASDKGLVFRSTALKKLGFQLATDYSILAGGPLPSHQVFDIIRLDVSAAPKDGLVRVVSALKNASFKLLATGVTGGTILEECRELDFDLFQGPFFLDLSSAMAEPISHSQAALISLSRDLKQNRDIEIIEQTFKGSPKLTFGLLQLMNSAYMGVRQKVTSIRHAIALLGYAALEKWVVMLLFTVDHGNDQTNPLVEKAVLRGMVMDRLAKQTGQKTVADSAFMTGMLSLFTLLFDVKIEKITEEMNLGEEIKRALLSREGMLGRLLSVTEKMDRREYTSMAAELEGSSITVLDVLEAETQSVFDCRSFFYRD
jgi:c-di-GMP-related signal transduction protein